MENKRILRTSFFAEGYTGITPRKYLSTGKKKKSKVVAQKKEKKVKKVKEIPLPPTYIVTKPTPTSTLYTPIRSPKKETFTISRLPGLETTWGGIRHTDEDLLATYAISMKRHEHSYTLTYIDTGNKYTWWKTKGSLIREKEGRYMKYGEFHDIEDVAQTIHKYDIEYTMSTPL